MARKKTAPVTQDQVSKPNPSPFLHIRLRPGAAEQIDQLVEWFASYDRTTLIHQLVREAFLKEQKRQAREKAK